MELREMRSLVVLSECGTIQETAERCNLSPPAVHKHLKTIEEMYGVRLYTKQGGRLELTEAGRLLLPFARDVLVQHEAAAAALNEWRDGRRGVLRVGAGPTFSSHLLPPLVKRYRDRFPSVDVFIETATGDHLLERLRGGHLDLIFDLAFAAEREPAVEIVALWKSPAAFICSRREAPALRRLEQIEKLPFIQFQPGTRMEHIVHRYFERLDFCPKVVMRSDSAEAIKAMIRSGLGISVLFLWSLNSEPHNGPLVALRTGVPRLISKMALIRIKSHYTSRVVHEFIALAKGMEWKNLQPATASR
jgi:LysR family transcriptional regulator, transcriptional activator of the cysJI operon